MKKLLPIISILFFAGSALSQNSPVEYMSKLSGDFDQINKDTWDYIKQVSRGKNAKKVEKRRIELVATLKTATYNAGKVSAYKNDPTLKQAYANYLMLSYEIISNGYKNIVDMEKVAEDSYDAMEAYLLTKERANKKLDSAYNDLKTAQHDFASKYHINLVENDTRLSRKLENAGEVNAYYNRLYLIFFKSSFYEGEMMKAQAEGRIGDIEQFRQTLETVSKEGIETLKKIGSFKGDYTFKVACIKAVQFFDVEASKYIPKQINFYSQKDHFDALTKNMESKKRSAITKQEVEEYNKAVAAYNNSINSFNETNTYLNKNRTKAYNDFNEAIEDFFSKFM